MIFNLVIECFRLYLNFMLDWNDIGYYVLGFSIMRNKVFFVDFMI